MNFFRLFRLCCVALPLTALTYSPIKAAEKNYSVNQDVMLTGAEEGRTLRLSGYGNVGKGCSIFGFLDSFGPVTSTQNTYGELHLSRGFRGPISGQAEINGGLKGPYVFRIGPKVKIPTPKGTYADLKILPLNTSTEDGILNEAQIGLFGSAEFGRWYLSNWTDHTMSPNREPSTLTEFTAGRQINSNFSLQSQAAKDVNSPGWTFRIGGRYKMF